MSSYSFIIQSEQSICSYITHNYKVSYAFKVIGTNTHYTLITYTQRQKINYIKQLYPKYNVMAINHFKELVKFFTKNKRIYTIDYKHHIDYLTPEQSETSHHINYLEPEQSEQINTFKTLAAIRSATEN